MQISHMRQTFMVLCIENARPIINVLFYPEALISYTHIVLAFFAWKVEKKRSRFKVSGFTLVDPFFASMTSGVTSWHPSICVITNVVII